MAEAHDGAKSEAQKVLDDKEAMDQAVQLNLYDPSSGFGYRRWNNKEGMMKPMEDREPLSAKKNIEVAQELATLSVQPQLLNRFHAARQLQEQMEGATVTWW